MNLSICLEACKAELKRQSVVGMLKNNTAGQRALLLCSGDLFSYHLLHPLPGTLHYIQYPPRFIYGCFVSYRWQLQPQMLSCSLLDPTSSHPVVAEPQQRTLVELHVPAHLVTWGMEARLQEAGSAQGCSGTSPRLLAPASSHSRVPSLGNHQLGATRLGWHSHAFWLE